MKGKIFYAIGMLLVMTFTAKAQRSVFQDLTWEQAAELAQKEGKIVLVDAMMQARTPQDRKKQDATLYALFAKPEISRFCEEHVVAIRIDMASEAGHAFAPKMTMFMYPAYAFFMPNGDILEVASPFMAMKDPEVILKAGEQALKAAAVKRQNSRTISFEEMTLKEAMAKAKKENKLIFIDAHTAWCQPCVLMVKNVFSLDRVADFYNQHFINLKIDFGKEKALAEKYGTSGYPAFLFVNGDGKLVHMAGGYTAGEEFIGYGQEALRKAEGITFVQGSWQQALDRAKRENKLIFIDCYTSWCGPCKMLAKTVFTDPEVAALFNTSFINVKMDMEKGEGKELKEKYRVTAYPTMHFIDGDAEVVHTVVGGVDAATLMLQAEQARTGKGLAYQNDEYRKGNREPAFIGEYLETLDLANLGEQAEKVCLEYFAGMDKSKLKEKAYWDLFAKYVNDADSEVFTYVYDHRQEFYEFLGENEVKAKIKTVWTIGANRFVQGKGEQAVLDKKGFKKYIRRLSKADVEGKFDIINNAKMNNAEKLGDWETYIALGSKQLEAGKVSDLVLYNWGLRIDRQCSDPAFRTQAAHWFEEAVAKEDKREAEGQKSKMSYRTYFEKMAADLKQPAKNMQ